MCLFTRVCISFISCSVHANNHGVPFPPRLHHTVPSPQILLYHFSLPISSVLFIFTSYPVPSSSSYPAPVFFPFLCSFRLLTYLFISATFFHLMMYPFPVDPISFSTVSISFLLMYPFFLNVLWCTFSPNQVMFRTVAFSWSFFSLSLSGVYPLFWVLSWCFLSPCSSLDKRLCNHPSPNMPLLLTQFPDVLVLCAFPPSPFPKRISPNITDNQSCVWAKTLNVNEIMGIMGFPRPCGVTFSWILGLFGVVFKGEGMQLIH